MQAVELVAAEADFSQKGFPPEAVLSSEQAGWAIAPQQSQSHKLIVYCRQPVLISANCSLRVRLVQQYGTQHTLGRFRLSTLAGFDPSKILPADVLSALRSPEQ